MQMTFLGVEKSSTDPVSSLEINNTEERGMKRFNVWKEGNNQEKNSTAAMTN